MEQRHQAEADLMAVRDLCVKLDQQKDSLVEQLGDKDTVKAHVNLLTLYPTCILFFARHSDFSTALFFLYSTRHNCQD